MKNMKKLEKKIVAVTVAAAMLLVAVAMVGGVLRTALADDYSQYEFTTGQLDPEFYAAMYPDVVAMVGTDPLELFRHYAEHGLFEGRIPYEGAEPGEFIAGYKGVDEEVAAQAAARAAEEVLQAQAEAAVRAQAIAAAQVGVGEYVYDYSVIHDLSDWTPEQMAMLAQKQVEFDASGLVHVGWTEQQVYDKLMWIKENLYPEGSYGSICEIGAGRIESALYGRDGDWMMGFYEDTIWTDKEGKRVMPIGFVEHEDTHRDNGEIKNIRDVRVGDMIYTVGVGGHVQVVLSHDDRGITVVESNINEDERFHWGRRISWDELENGGNNIYLQQNKCTRYVSYMY